MARRSGHRATANRGYQAANNQGMRAWGATRSLLINADAMLTPGCLDVLQARSDADPRVVIVGPRLVYKDGSFQRWTAGQLPSLRAGASYFFFADRLPSFGSVARARRRRRVRTGLGVECLHARSSPCRRRDRPHGRAILRVHGRRRILCRAAAADAGWTVWYEPAAT